MVPIGILLYIWVATIWGGALELRAATWYALLAISTMACGLAGEFTYSVIPVGWALDFTTASQGDTLYVLVGGGVIGGFAALHYWFPKLCGRLLGEGVGKVALVLMVDRDPPLRASRCSSPGSRASRWTSSSTTRTPASTATTWSPRSAPSSSSSGSCVELGNAAYSWHNGLPARGHDPWRGATLEWFALSPPPPHNFDAVPDVRSPEPLHDIRESIRGATEAFERPAAARAGRRPRPRARSPRRPPSRGARVPSAARDSDDGDSSSVA